MMKNNKVSSVRMFITESRFINCPKCQYDWESAEVLQLVGNLLATFYNYFCFFHTVEEITTSPNFCLGTITTSEEENDKKVVIDGHQMLTTLLLMLISLQGRKHVNSNWTDYDSEPETWHYSRTGFYRHTEFMEIIETMNFGQDSEGASKTSYYIVRRFGDIDRTLHNAITDVAHPLFTHWLLDKVTINELLI